MKNLLIIAIVFAAFTSAAQKKKDISGERYGNTLNVGAGIGYYGYISNPLPVVVINYEIGVIRNLTLAPFIGLYSYRNNDYAFNTNPNGYSYRETVAPVGVKGSYYFDQLLRASSKWDFYAAASIGALIRRVAWDVDYYGSRAVYQPPNPLYMDAHAGAEYHINKGVGFYLDISTGVSTVGLAMHF